MYIFAVNAITNVWFDRKLIDDVEPSYRIIIRHVSHLSYLIWPNSWRLLAYLASVAYTIHAYPPLETLFSQLHNAIIATFFNAERL